ncbi:MAG: peptidase T4 [Maricaulis sp.]|nr:peptidase T4 [Maricaulis sp.]HAQ34945.1 peptidase T4 [Alphaproteobacteria bacterium]
MPGPGARNLITDVAGLRVGQADDPAVRTGVTVILTDERAVCAVDVRGGGPGTRETDALAPHTLVDAVDAVVLSGGSSWGLASADAVAAALGARRRGYAVFDDPAIPVSPVVPSAILYDLNNGGEKDWGEEPPYRRLARAALESVSHDLALGRAGAGFGAMAGSAPGGLGSASFVTDDGITIGALAAVNSFGSVRVPGCAAFWASPFELKGEFGGAAIPAGSAAGEDWGEAKINPGAGQNTTIACVATDAVLTPSQAQRIAVMAQAGLVRAIRPAHTPFDGDTVFVVSTGRKVLPEPAAYTLSRLGSLAADTLARAIARGVYEAAGQAG